MISEIFGFLDTFENVLWGAIGVPAIFVLGLFLTVKSNFFQITHFPRVFRTFFGFLRVKSDGGGVHPLTAFFACIGGCVGVGNVVGICTAVQIGGPGALLWIWITAVLGMVVKYAEVYLGVKYRVSNGKGGYNGGPMYFLQRMTKKKWVPVLVSLLLCVYGVEVYQFSVITESLASNFDLNRTMIVFFLLALVIFAAVGGVSRVGGISATIIPIFFVLYSGMGLWVFFHNLSAIPSVLYQVCVSAFTGHAAVGGFFGSTIVIAMSQGVKRGCYTADVGVGYASVIHSESSASSPAKQASLVIFDIFIDTFILCTTSVMLILVTDVWKEPMEAGLLVQTALGMYFPYMDYFIPIFLFMLGYSTITAFFCVGLKCAEFVSPKWGRVVYNVYSVVALTSCAFVDTAQAQTMMAIAGGLLLVINCWGIYYLRHEISYELEEFKPAVPAPAL